MPPQAAPMIATAAIANPRLGGRLNMTVPRVMIRMAEEKVFFIFQFWTSLFHKGKVSRHVARAAPERSDATSRLAPRVYRTKKGRLKGIMFTPKRTRVMVTPNFQKERSLSTFLIAGRKSTFPAD